MQFIICKIIESEEMGLRNSKIFFAVVFLSVSLYLPEEFQFYRFCRKKVIGLKNQNSNHYYLQTKKYFL